MIKKHIPNTITCCNLICGCIATWFAFLPDYGYAMAFIVAGAVFDFFDGFMARMLKVSSTIGKELDSLADDITFGFAPAAILFSLLKEVPAPASWEVLNAAYPYVAFLIAAFSALRLAKFNLDERQTTSFLGLPTPANALFWAALALGLREWLTAQSYAWILLCLLCLISCALLVSEIPMFALKFKHFGWKGNGLRYSFVVLSAALLVTLGWTGFSVIIVCYILASLLEHALGNQN